MKEIRSVETRRNCMVCSDWAGASHTSSQGGEWRVKNGELLYPGSLTLAMW